MAGGPGGYPAPIPGGYPAPIPGPGTPPTDAARELREALHAQALPDALRTLHLRGEPYAQAAGEGSAVVTASLTVAGLANATADGYWALLAAGAVLARTGHEIVPARYDGGPDPSLLSGLVWGGLLAAVAGEYGFEPHMGAGAPDRPAPAARTRVDAERAAAAIPDGLGAACDRTAEAISAELARAVPGAGAASAAVALGVAGAWLSEGAASLCAPLTRRRGLLHGALRYAPEGCALAGGLLAAAGLRLTG